MSDKSIILGSIVFGDKKFELRVDEAPVYGREIKFSSEVIELAEDIIRELTNIPVGASYEISYTRCAEIARICALIK